MEDDRDVPVDAVVSVADAVSRTSVPTAEMAVIPVLLVSGSNVLGADMAH